MQQRIHINESLASCHYPQIRFQHDERLLWNPVTKKVARVRPEERVRLQFIDYLILEAGLSANRIASETPVPSRYSHGRTDILCYNRQFDPFMLIECKADSVKLGPKTATQSATYNRFIKAPYVMLTNGLQDALFQVEKSLEPLKAEYYPDLLTNRNRQETTPEYWMNRGFLHPGRGSKGLYSLLNRLFLATDPPKTFIRISFPPDSMPLHHYYALLNTPEQPDSLIAFSVIAALGNQNILTAVCNKKSKNIGCLRIFLRENGVLEQPELFVAGQSATTSPPIADLQEIINNFNDSDNDTSLRKLSGNLESLFFSSTETA